MIPLPRRHIASPGHVARPRRAPARVRALLTGALLLGGLIAACGGGGTSATAERPATAVPASPTAERPATAVPASATAERPATAVPASPTATPTIAASSPASATASPTPSTTVEPSPTPEPTPTAEPTPAEPVASTASIPLAELPRVELVRADGSAVSLPVEIPPRSDYGLGLSGRYELEGRGMVFYYPQGTSAIGFYMKNTHIDLAIAFVGPDDRVIAIRQMVAESLDLVRPGGVYHYAVEAPAGWYAERGITEGALLRLPPGLELPE